MRLRTNRSTCRFWSASFSFAGKLRFQSASSAFYSHLTRSNYPISMKRARTTNYEWNFTPSRGTARGLRSRLATRSSPFAGKSREVRREYLNLLHILDLRFLASSDGIFEMMFRGKFHTDDIRHTRGREKRATLCIKRLVSTRAKIEQIFQDSGFDSKSSSVLTRWKYCGNRNCHVLFFFILRSTGTVRVKSYKGLVVTFPFGHKPSTTARPLDI